MPDIHKTGVAIESSLYPVLPYNDKYILYDFEIQKQTKTITPKQSSKSFWALFELDQQECTYKFLIEQLCNAYTATQ